MAKKVGRPTKYTKALTEKICEELAKGNPLSKICDDEKMPHLATIYRWLRSYPKFCELYEKARLDQADTLADEIAKIADEAEQNGEDPRYTKIRVDARKWVAAKLKPQKYSEKQTIEHDVSSDLSELLKEIAGEKDDLLP